jgi:hypothetical protein
VADPALELDPVQQFKNSTLRKLHGLTCSSHGQSPIVEFHGCTLRDIRISMRCCCRELSTRANQAIVQPAPIAVVGR